MSNGQWIVGGDLAERWGIEAARFPDFIRRMLRDTHSIEIEGIKEGFFAEPESGGKLVYGEHDRLVNELITWERWFQPAIDKHNLSSMYRYRLFPWECYEAWISKQDGRNLLEYRLGMACGVSS